jgi:hypothetical protein
MANTNTNREFRNLKIVHIPGSSVPAQLAYEVRYLFFTPSRRDTEAHRAVKADEWLDAADCTLLASGLSCGFPSSA